MNVKLIYQTHKWLAVAALVPSLAWFISGVVLVLPGQWRTPSASLVAGSNAEATIANAPAFEDARVSVASAIATVRAQRGGTGRISAVGLRQFPGRLAYQIGAPDGTHLVDAASGAIFTVDAAMAEQIARQALGPGVVLGPVTVQREPSSDYRGPFPAYRVPAADGRGTVVYVAGTTGDARLSDRRSRMFSSIVGWHDFFVLQSFLPTPGIRLTLLAFGIVGTLTSIAGAVILVVQLQRWQRGRTRRAKPTA